MRRVLPLLALLLVPFPSAALADGCPPSTCGSTSTAAPGSGAVLVRPDGRAGRLQAFSVRTGQRLFTLPPGILSADGRTFISSARVKSPRTTVVRYNVRSGDLVHGWSVAGRYWYPAGMTADGRRSALLRIGRRMTFIRVGRAQIVLRGFYEVEALSPNGKRLFLIHWKNDGYELQQLDLATRTLSPTRLDEPDEKMSGVATGSVAARDGHWLLTLYSKADGHSFVHALDLRTGLAHCIDLQLKGDLITLGSTALTLSPDERTLYLTSPYIGSVTTVDLATLEPTRVVRFPRIALGQDLTVGPSAAVTPNGRVLSFSGRRSLWFYDTAFGVVRRAKGRPTEITGLGFRPDGRRLLVLQRRGAPIFLDAATGRRLG
jgi:hypothetical protein